MPFEYKIVSVDASKLYRSSSFQRELDTKFNEWGQEDWELIKFEPITGGGLLFQGATTKEFIAIFKRKKDH